MKHNERVPHLMTARLFVATSLTYLLLFAANSALATLADLAPQSISASPNPATVGGNVTISYKVANTGGTAAPASHTKVQIKNAANAPLTVQMVFRARIVARSRTEVQLM